MAEERERADLPTDPVVEEYKKHLDLTLLVESLKRTPEERIEAIQQMNALVAQMRKGMPAPRSGP
jgi:hypothetical protein